MFFEIWQMTKIDSSLKLQDQLHLKIVHEIFTFALAKLKELASFYVQGDQMFSHPFKFKPCWSLRIDDNNFIEYNQFQNSFHDI